MSENVEDRAREAGLREQVEDYEATLSPLVQRASELERLLKRSHAHEEALVLELETFKRVRGASEAALPRICKERDDYGRQVKEWAGRASSAEAAVRRIARECPHYDDFPEPCARCLADVTLDASVWRQKLNAVADLNHTCLEAALREDQASLLIALYTLSYDEREALHEAASWLAKEALASIDCPRPDGSEEK